MVRRLGCWLVVALLLTSAQVWSEDELADSDRKTIDHWLGVAKEVAKRQQIVALDAPDKPFELREKAIFRHTQSVRGDDIGAVYLWTDASSERPAAIGVFFGWSQDRNRNVMEEFHSLHDGPIRRTAAGHATWTSNAEGLQWKQTSDLPAPMKDRRRLRLQARQFPRLLKVQTASSSGQSWKLRNVPAPFYEYSDPNSGIHYGAIFGFCQGTDTELLVLIEARQVDDERAWFFSLAPFSDYQITAQLPDGTSWDSPNGSMNENGKPHYWAFVETRPKPDFER